MARLQEKLAEKAAANGMICFPETSMIPLTSLAASAIEQQQPQQQPPPDTPHVLGSAAQALLADAAALDASMRRSGIYPAQRTAARPLFSSGAWLAQDPLLAYSYLQPYLQAQLRTPARPHVPDEYLQLPSAVPRSAGRHVAERDRSAALVLPAQAVSDAKKWTTLV
jgi:hypothetical protein